MVTVFGLKNCDTCRNAIKWLVAEKIEHRFLDVRKDGLSANDVDRWCAEIGWETLLNRRGTTWRKLDDDIKNSIDENSAKALMLEQPAMIKRPVFVTEDAVFCGFKEPEKSKLKES
jgi:arsenate reductase